MNTTTSPTYATAMPAPMSAGAYAARYAASCLIRIPAGTRVEWQGRVGTVTHGNLPSEWAPAGSGTVSIEFDVYPRGATRYAEVFADEVRIIAPATVWEV